MQQSPVNKTERQTKKRGRRSKKQQDDGGDGRKEVDEGQAKERQKTGYPSITMFDRGCNREGVGRRSSGRLRRVWLLLRVGGQGG